MWLTPCAGPASSWGSNSCFSGHPSPGSHYGHSGQTPRYCTRPRCSIPQTGELYAVYFGTAFHLGVSIGNGEIVHYLNDNHVYRVTWEQFLEGRSPEHWTYPDLESIPVETVVRTALSEVGKTYEYSLLRFNCEHFAIYCKTGR